MRGTSRVSMCRKKIWGPPCLSFTDWGALWGGDELFGYFLLTRSLSLAGWQVSHFNIWPGCVLLKRARKLSAPYLTHCMLNIHLTSLSPLELCKPVIGTARPVVGSRAALSPLRQNPLFSAADQENGKCTPAFPTRLIQFEILRQLIWLEHWWAIDL